MNINAKIATLILRAQNSSDGGKQIDCIANNRRSHRDNCVGYPQKDVTVESALRLICSNKSAFKFAVICDKSGVADYLVYFETRINGEKLQVSFLSFDEKLSKYVTKSFRMKWNHGDSRESAMRIYIHFVPNGEYMWRGGDDYE